MVMNAQRRLVAGTIAVAVLAAAGAAFAAVRLEHATRTERMILVRPNAGIGGFGLGGRLGGRGLGGGLGAGASAPRGPGFGRGFGGQSTGAPRFGLGTGLAFGLFGQGLATATSYLGIDAATLRGEQLGR